jgi:cytochrome c oxidase assembly protein subunit 15
VRQRPASAAGRAATPEGRPSPGEGAGLHRFALVVCAATFFLIFAGGLVTSTESGLAVPDWPLSFGQVFPEMTGGVFYEHGHRMVAAAVGMLTIGLYLRAWFGGAAAGVRLLSGIALGAVVAQGLLGGLTVLMRLPPAVSVSHACLAQAFLCLTVAVALVTGRAWRERGAPREDASAVPLRWLSAATAAAVYGQLILGAVVRHTRAGLAIPDFPLAYGRLIPPLVAREVQIHFAHRVWAVVVAALAGWLVARILRFHGRQPLLARPAILLAALVAAQIFLGGLTVWTGKAVLPTTLHVLGGAMVLGTSFVIAMRTHVLFAPRGRRREAEHPLPQGAGA